MGRAFTGCQFDLAARKGPPYTTRILVPLLVLMLVACDASALTIVSKAATRVEQFDLAGAVEMLRTAGDCDEAAGGVEYLEGLLGAAEAVKQGGTVESLRDVRSAANALSRRAGTGGRRWEAASLAMRAVAAASQYERGEMSIYLAEAARIEGLLLAAGLPGVPFIAAHELAGELWLQVHRYHDARSAFQRAADVVGRTGRVRLGLARAAARLKDTAACTAYNDVLTWWGARSGNPLEIEEARSYVESPVCRGRQR